MSAGTDEKRGGPNRIIRRAVLAAVPVLAAATLGTLVTVPNLPWYATLAKPGFNPPNAVFGPVWSLLYLGMAVALFRILGQPSRRRAKRGAILMFLLQMLLNAVWSAAFFSLHDPVLASIVITALIATVADTLRRFFVLDRIAGGLLAPYLAWIVFAAALNGAIVALNATTIGL